jgi:hypothetical protein
MSMCGLWQSGETLGSYPARPTLRTGLFMYSGKVLESTFRIPGLEVHLKELV